jgi:predicted PurR-regulated permease PerM
MKNTMYKQHIAWGVTVFSVIGLSILVFFIFYRAAYLLGALRGLFGILKPFIYGAALAYILNPIYRRCETILTRLLTRRFKRPGWAVFWARFISTIIILLFSFVALFGLLYLVLPQLALSVSGIIERIPNYLTEIKLWIDQIMDNSPHVGPLLLSSYQSLAGSVEEWLNANIADMLPLLTAWAKRAYTGLLSVFAVLFNLVIGIVVMVYLLNGKRAFAAQSKKLLYSLLGAQKGNTAVEIVRYAHRVFGGFINGKLIESILVGITCFIFMTVTKMPYVLLISVIIGVTNVIPFFGPFIGAIPSALLLLFESPTQCLYFLIFILIIHQLTGSILGPRILGVTTGLPSFWVLFSILFFGRMFGFVGMVLGVPVFALIYSLIKALIRQGLKKQELPYDTGSYNDLHHIDDDHKLVKNGEI